ncbi:MAG: arsenate reductase ArsC [Alphaproteobacteria bacterium]|nr:MAG: arsenate reductase ArsC [Alphaproteobacteria bacterium]
MKPKRPYNFLFLCTGNSARSILGEAILNRLGKGWFHAFSAGSTPAGKVNPNAIALLMQQGYITDDLRSKSWDEFAAPGASKMDFVITVCDNAKGEVCPIWPGQPMTAHWGIPDPAAVEGSPAEIAAAFRTAYRQLFNRIEQFLALPLKSIDRISLHRQLQEIGAETSLDAAID